MVRVILNLGILATKGLSFLKDIWNTFSKALAVRFFCFVAYGVVNLGFLFSTNWFEGHLNIDFEKCWRSYLMFIYSRSSETGTLSSVYKNLWGWLENCSANEWKETGDLVLVSWTSPRQYSPLSALKDKLVKLLILCRRMHVFIEYISKLKSHFLPERKR